MFNFGFKAIIFYVISKCSYIFFCKTEMFINFFNVNFFLIKIVTLQEINTLSYE